MCFPNHECSRSCDDRAVALFHVPHAEPRRGGSSLPRKVGPTSRSEGAIPCYVIVDPGRRGVVLFSVPCAKPRRPRRGGRGSFLGGRAGPTLKVRYLLVTDPAYHCLSHGLGSFVLPLCYPHMIESRSVAVRETQVRHNALLIRGPRNVEYVRPRLEVVSAEADRSTPP